MLSAVVTWTIAKMRTQVAEFVTCKWYLYGQFVINALKVLIQNYRNLMEVITHKYHCVCACACVRAHPPKTFEPTSFHKI